MIYISNLVHLDYTENRRSVSCLRPFFVVPKCHPPDIARSNASSNAVDDGERVKISVEAEQVTTPGESVMLGSFYTSI
jgi:hypothetical protein